MSLCRRASIITTRNSLRPTYCYWKHSTVIKNTKCAAAIFNEGDRRHGVIFMQSKFDPSLSGRSMSSTSAPITTAVHSTNPVTGTVAFDDPESAHGPKPLSVLLRSIVVLNLCRWDFLVSRGPELIRYSNRLLGSTMTNSLLRQTFYKHFCAGEDSIRMRPTVQYLAKNNIGSIVNYCAENAPDDLESSTSSLVTDSRRIIICPPGHDSPLVYNLAQEDVCDIHRDNFLKSLDTVQQVAPTNGLVAIKITALATPLLLERVSSAYNALESVFYKLADSSPTISKHHLSLDILKLRFSNSPDEIDIVEWMSKLSLQDLPSLGITKEALADEELNLMQAMIDRADTIAQMAATNSTRLLVDAEQTWYQPAIRYLTLQLQQRYNTNTNTEPIVFNTYQCYLKETPQVLRQDMDRANRLNYAFAGKLVRGAYISAERNRATAESRPSPIHETLQETHDCYNTCMEYVLRQSLRQTLPPHVFCASRNQDTIERTVRLLNQVQPQPKVSFAQLLGMSDHLTFTLGKHHFDVYKCLPYGAVHEAIPYLLRRAQENRDMLAQNTDELSLLYKEVWRRIKKFTLV